MKSNFSVKAILRTDKVLKNGNSPIFIQVFINSEKKTYSLGESVEKKFWDKKSGLAVGKGFGTLNSIINKRISDIVAHCNQAIMGGVPLSFSIIDNFVKGYQNNNFFKVFDEVLELKKPDLSDDTYYKYQTLRTRLKNFKSKIFVSEIDLALIKKFDNYLKNLGIGDGGVYNHHKCLKCIINDANRFKKAKIETPYGAGLFIIKSLKHKEIFLDKDEVLQFKAYKTTNLLNQTVKDMFLLSCYSGLRYSDLHSLKMSDIDWENGVITKKMLKTQHNIDIPLNKQTRQLLLRHINNKKPNDKIFMEVSNQVGNRILKTIANACKINKQISFHVGRHTFASFLVNNNNVSLPLVSKLLGHVNMSNTLIYTNSHIGNLKQVMDNVHYG
ncbi:tyrosine-type recombinase/integrase [Epilithonimonas sp.]|uniref:tyrosine-type recombinase/integrase n=1 Tax=Epilithonimonas sp. TaxID=2894511 RepID=UPI0028B12FB3|nr:tyrosine-type recombinase/integrase [Epilithonimonas sp.]